MHTLYSPLRLQQTKKKMFTLGLNQYRNTHFRVLNNMKIKYKEVMAEQVLALPKMDKVIIDYILYPKTKHLCDLDNILSVHSKFIQDSLVELDRLPDDNYLHILESRFRFGEIDKLNPRVEIIIKEIK